MSKSVKCSKVFKMIKTPIYSIYSKSETKRGTKSKYTHFECCLTCNCSFVLPTAFDQIRGLLFVTTITMYNICSNYYNLYKYSHIFLRTMHCAQKIWATYVSVKIWSSKIFLTIWTVHITLPAGATKWNLVTQCHLKPLIRTATLTLKPS